MNISKEDVYSKYPWLQITTTLEEYVAPSYYDLLIKDYAYKGKSDLDYFLDFLKTLPNQTGNVLELGSGTGRVTKAFLDSKKFTNLTLVDLSSQMLKSAEERFNSVKNISFVLSDSLNYLNHTTDLYDLTYTMWSFSHSVHQHYDGTEQAVEEIKSCIKKFVKQNLKSNGKFFLTHFDTLSDEQRILTKQWIKVSKQFTKFYENKEQSPSKQILDNLFRELKSEGLIDYSVEHIIGDEIIYPTLDNALEVFMNFHLESYFNDLEILSEVVEDLENELRRYEKADGTIRIKPGFFNYIIEKN